MKKITKCWAIKLRGRSFLLNSSRDPFLFRTEIEAKRMAHEITFHKEIKTEVIRVKVRVEETT